MQDTQLCIQIQYCIGHQTIYPALTACILKFCSFSS